MSRKMKRKYYKFTKEYCDYLTFLHSSYKSVKDYIFYYHLVKRDTTDIARKIRKIATQFCSLFHEEICNLPAPEGYGFIDEFAEQLSRQLEEVEAEE